VNKGIIRAPNFSRAVKQTEETSVAATKTVSKTVAKAAPAKAAAKGVAEATKKLAAKAGVKPAPVKATPAEKAKPEVKPGAKPATKPASKPVPAVQSAKAAPPVKPAAPAKASAPSPAKMKAADTKPAKPDAAKPAEKPEAKPIAAKPASKPKSAKKSAKVVTEAELLAMSDDDYMNEAQLAFFRAKLEAIREEMLENARETGEHLKENEVFADPNDRATVEEENMLEQRVRDRERKLLKKIESTLNRIESGDYGYCKETGEPIGLPRLLARPTADLSIEAQEKHERLEKLYAD
jgi:DnaK suppressor protein